jgi:hypothetical protein
MRRVPSASTCQQCQILGTWPAACMEHVQACRRLPHVAVEEAAQETEEYCRGHRGRYL